MTEEPLARGEQTRQQIVRTAYELFLQQGYHGTSMRQVAEGAGIALGGIYNHFPGKEEIFLAVVQSYHPIYEVLAIADSVSGESAAAIVRAAASQMVRQFEKSSGFINLLFIELVEFGGRHVPIIFKQMYPMALAFAQRIFADRPELRPIPIPILVRAFIGMFFSYVITETLLARALPSEQRSDAFDVFVDIFLHGVLKEGAQP